MVGAGGIDGVVLCNLWLALSPDDEDCGSSYDLSAGDLAGDPRVHGAEACGLALGLSCATGIDERFATSVSTC